MNTDQCSASALRSSSVHPMGSADPKFIVSLVVIGLSSQRMRN
ncbi:hypothetical protein NY08_4992 [Rhodococcus sp. B7740]|nr:hypothetical protein NY08_4992 [Rhodococcus sp. B7740]